MSDQGVSLTLVVCHDIYVEVARQRDGLSENYEHCSAVVWVSPATLKRLSVSDGDTVRLTSEGGSVVVRAKAQAGCPEGIGYMPASLYAARLAYYRADSPEFPALKHIKATAYPSTEGITRSTDLLQRRT